MKTTLKATVYAVTPAKSGARTLSVSHTLGVEIGSICCALNCQDDEIYQRLSGLYRNFLTERSPDITIDLERAADVEPPPGGDGSESPFSVLVDQPDVFSAGMEWENSEHDQGIRYMNGLFDMAYYTACLEKYGGDPPAMLVHACGVLRHGRAVVFAGPSDSGKTTVARLCGENDGRVINDEMVLVSRPGAEGGAAIVQSAPMIGSFPPGVNVRVPLSCILLLKKGSRTRVGPTDPADAYLRFVRQVITPLYIGQRELRPALTMVADFSQEMVGAVPMYELEFTVDGRSLWREIGELEERLYGRVRK